MPQSNDAYLDALAERLEIQAITLKVIGEVIQELSERITAVESKLRGQQ